ncbi:tripartite motif-containing protein 2-like [Dysidea avara]|uniref:tripartite motif-containing protein 2-like n=1 Tax=Dysidea avara TaxID=196820 RepID=UPI003316FF92
MLNMVKMKNTLEKKSGQEALSNNAAKQKQIIDECLQKLKPSHDKINLEPADIDNIKLFPSLSLFPEFCHLSVGAISTDCNSELLIPDKVFYLNDKVTVTLLTRDSQGHYFSEGGNQVSMQLKSSKGKITTIKVKDNCDGSYVALVKCEQVGVAKLVVSINGQKIVGSPYNIIVHRKYKTYDGDEYCATYKSKMGEPWGVAFGRYGVWAAASNSNHCVYVFDGQDNFIRKIGSSGTNDSEFSAPRGIAFDNDNHLYVVDSGNHRVQKFGINGNYLLQFGCHDLNDGQLKDPYGITARDGKVYIADKGYHRISVFQSDGQFCIFFGSDQLGGPYDVAVNGNNQLLVADHSNNCIVSFTIDGDYVTKFDTRGPNKKLCGPCCLTTDENGYILVVGCESNVDLVSIFDHSGQLIHYTELNSYYQSENKSNVATYRSIALCPNGSIYISNKANCEIKVVSTEK